MSGNGEKEPRIERSGSRWHPSLLPPKSPSQLLCRACRSTLCHTVLDLGVSPLANAYLSPAQRDSPELFYPLHLWVCSDCLLVQVEQFETPDRIFGDYPYFSSYSESWLKHAEDYARAMIARLGLGPDSFVVEPASNDGYLLQYFRRAGVPVLGIDPAANVAAVAEERGIETLVSFFGEAVAGRVAKERGKADLIVANNVLAHVPNLNDFVAGLARLLAPNGVVTVEFPHLVELMENNEFDTIYHEHFSYFTFLTAERVFAAHGLVLFDVEGLRTHGGSLRVYGRHAADLSRPVSDAVLALRGRERSLGYHSLDRYLTFADGVHRAKRDLLRFLIWAKDAGYAVVGYGAPAKATVLLNFCGVGPDLLAYTVDVSPYKQGRYVPGVRIPILHPQRIFETRPDYVLILPWNLQEEIMTQMAGIGAWGGQFVIPIPDLRIHAPSARGLSGEWLGGASA